MNDTGAIVPEAPILMSEEIAETEDVQQEAALDQARELAEVMTAPGWKLIEQRMKNDIENFRTGKFLGDPEGVPLVEIGQKYVIASTVADKLQGYLDMVTGAAESVVKREQERKQQQLSESERSE